MSQTDPDSGLSPEQEHALSAVLDEIIPESSDGRLPAAGTMGLASIIAGKPDMLEVIVQGLSVLDELAGSRGADGFVALEKPDRVEALDELTTREPGFLPAMVFQTYVAYYQEGRVMEALGLEARPPFPKGYEVEPSDLSLLDEVRRRPPLYRQG